MSHAQLSEAVRAVVATAGPEADIAEVVERARSAMVAAEGTSLFGLETEHPDYGSVHWIVGQSPPDDSGYVALAIAGRRDTTDAWPLFTASGDSLSETLSRLAADCGVVLGSLVEA